MSLAASDGLMLGRDYHFDLVRPGYALYGGQALPGRITPVKPVVEAYARVLQVRDAGPRPDGRLWRQLRRRTQDRGLPSSPPAMPTALPRHLSAATGRIGRSRRLRRPPVPIVGRVSMDLITVDVTDFEDTAPQRGDWVELIGPTITLEDVGAASGTIGYEILTRLSPRFPRVYLGGPAPAPTEPEPWPRPPNRNTSARPAAPSHRAGPANAPVAASGTRLVEELTGAPPPGSGLSTGSKGRHRQARRPQGRDRRHAAHRNRHRRTRPRHRRRHRPGLGPADRRRTRHRQIDAAAAGRRGDCPKGGRALYFSGEEAIAQVRLRAERLGLAETPVELAAETNLANILATLSDGPRADLVIIDSIQTLWADALEAAPGTVSQVRAATQSLIRYAKHAGCALILVGHVTKEGSIAGPKVIEHMVDTVLYFEGERGHAFRILRTVKNRFGPTNEIGVFEMATKGLREVQNPSELFLGDRESGAPGAAVFAGMEGTRPMLVEIQALVAPSPLGNPRRAVVGWDSNRLSMLLAVLDARCGVSLAQCDVYLNVAGGLKITEPAADLAAAAALLSSFSGVPLPVDRVYFGEISLSGAVRAAAHTPTRLKEAEKLGFTKAIIPAQGEFDKRPPAWRSTASDT